MFLVSIASIIALIALTGGPGRPRKLPVPTDNQKLFSFAAWGKFRPREEADPAQPAEGPKRARNGTEVTDPGPSELSNDQSQDGEEDEPKQV